MRTRLFIDALRLTGVGLSFLLALGPVSAVATPASERPLDVPLPRIERAHRNAVRSMMESPTLVRRMPARSFHSDKKTYVYLIDNLPLSSRLSDLLGYGSYRVTALENGRFHGEDFRGIKGDFWLVYSDPNKRIYLGKGAYDTWYIPRISAKILLVAEFTETGPGEMATRVDIYVSTNRLVGYLMDFMGRVTDEKLSQLITSAQYTSQELSSDPRGVWGKMTSSDLFTPEEFEDCRDAILMRAGEPEAATPRPSTTR